MKHSEFKNVDRTDEQKYSIYPIWTKNQRLVRDDDRFRARGLGDERSFDIGDYEFYGEGKTWEFNESEAKEICDYFGWDFDLVALEAEDDE